MRVNATIDERIPVGCLNASLRPLRSSATWGNGGPHSAEPSIPDKDEAAGSSPARPTTPRLPAETLVVGNPSIAAAPGSRLRAAVSERIPALLSSE
jgi:hypothetical protein